MLLKGPKGMHDQARESGKVNSLGIIEGVNIWAYYK